MTWEISKQFNFAYGHRVWTQKLIKDYSLNRQCVCRHLHGHEGKVHVFLTGDSLDPQGMVTDFLHLEWLKKFLDSAIDHKFMIDICDPLYNRIVGDDVVLEDIFVPDSDISVAKRPAMHRLPLLPDSPDYEYYDGLVVVDFVPTSENLSKWLYGVVDAKMSQINVTTSKVEWWETEKSRAIYTKPQ